MSMLKAINRLRKSKGLPDLTEYEFELPEINECREAVGLPKIISKRRPCIVCNHYFKSFSPFHRVCDDCRPSWAKIEPDSLENSEYHVSFPKMD